ncbi:hypothetical protein ABK730_18635 [Klebsiella indica]|nr:MULTISPECIES: hypothetical protein [Klebsiella]
MKRRTGMALLSGQYLAGKYCLPKGLDSEVEIAALYITYANRQS